MALSSTVKFVLAFGIMTALVLPGMYLIPRSSPSASQHPPYIPPQEPEPSLPLSNQEAWEVYSGNGAWQNDLNQSLFTRNVTLGELRVLAGEEAERALSGGAANASPPSPSKGSGEGAYGAADTSQQSGQRSQTREVEEADIVKLQDHYLYVLNPYRGLIIVDLAERDRPAVSSAVRLQGYPKDMYVVGNLSFIILSSSYGYWYNYYLLDATARSAGELVGGVEVTIGTHIAVVNLRDKVNPRVVMNIPLPGFASDSRRVGDVVYAVTNSYAWTGYGSDNGGTYVTSVDFTQPSKVRRVDTLFFNGTSNQVHASSTAFFIAQPQNEYFRERFQTLYSTKITYIDISDPQGAIRARDSFVVPGTLQDKYQMDHFQNTFRIVTHFWGQSGQLGSSTLTIYDVSSPDSIQVLGSLDINDAGTLMATRFAGNRAYTIHLPRSIDPLDVLDLSDPRNPKLTDVLEMPGWVTHIEVRGYRLLALGVDDSGGTQNVAVSLFDVTDPFNAVLKARVRIGSGYSWSLANWEPKALTVVDEQNIVIVPFSSSSGDYYYQRTLEGIQLVEFDLDRGTLAARGAITGTEPITRTRAYGDRVLATSDYALQMIDASDRASPRVIARIQFVWNIQDAFRMGGAEVQLFSEGWEGATGIRIVKPGASDWDKPLSEIKLDLSQIALFPAGKMLYIVGLQGSELKVLAYDLSDPSAPRPAGSASKTLPASAGPIDYGVPRGRDALPSYYYYISLRTALLENRVLAVLPELYSGEPNRTLYLFDLSAGQPQALSDYVFKIGNPPAGKEGYYYSYYYIGDFLGAGKTLYLTFWNGDGYLLKRIGLADPRAPVEYPDSPLKGQLVGAEPDGSAVYTTTYIYNLLGNGTTGGYTFNVYNADVQGLRLAYAVEFNRSLSSARVSGGKAYISLSNGGYYYDYGYGAAPERIEGDMKGGAPAYIPPQTDLVVLDLKASGGPELVGKIGLDGYASIAEVSGSTVFVSGEGMLAAYEFTDGALHFSGALAIRGYVQKLRPFDGGALLSEGLYGTETLLSRY